MTKNKSTTDSTKQEGEVTQVDKSNCESKKLKQRKKVPRIVEIEDIIHDDATDKHLKLNQLFQDFNLKVEASPLPLSPEFPDQIKNDYLLKRLLFNFEQKKDENTHLVKLVRSRWESCHLSPDYHDYLSILLLSSINSLNNLNKAIDKLHPAIIKRINLISVKKLETQHIIDARNKFIGSLDRFSLSLSVLQFNSKVYSQATNFKKQIQVFIKEFYDKLCSSNLNINSSILEELMSHLYQHLGLKKHILGIFSEIDPKPVCVNEINYLINGLFRLKDEPYQPQVTKNLLLTYYDLAARLDDSPIHSIQKFEHLYYLNKIQHDQITNKFKDLTKSFTQLSSQINELKILFIETEYEFGDLKEANDLISQMHDVIMHLKLNTDTYNKICIDQVMNQYEPQLSQLQQFGQLQEKLLEKLSVIEQQVITFESRTKSCVLRLEELYTHERYILINRLKDALNQAKYAFEIQNKPQLLDEIEKTTPFVQALMTSNSNLPLDSIKIQTQPKINKLMGYVNELKTTLKVEWANKICSLLAIKKEVPQFSINDTHFTMQTHLHIYHEPFTTTQLSPTNPLQLQLNEVTEECNLLVSQFSIHFDKLKNTRGEELQPWIKWIKNLYQRSQDCLLNQNTIRNQALIIENRLHSNFYRTCLKIIKIINNEFISILQSHLKKTNPKVINNETLNSIMINPHSLLLKDDLSLDFKNILEQIDPLLMKLFTLSKEFQNLNNCFISPHLKLCSENNYISQLLSITVAHIDKDGRELYSKGINTADRFIEWVHINVYKPFLNYYIPQEMSPLSSKPSSFNSAFFSNPKPQVASTAKLNSIDIPEKVLEIFPRI